jgi:hypothetical protein
MLCWNTGTTWWIWNSTDVGTIAAITANSLLMCIPWLGYRTFLKKYGKRIGYCALVFFWMSFEYIHLNWQISWPWLSLGNVFSLHPNWVQWYEYTGIGGGTLLIVATNIFLYECMLEIKKPAAERKLTKPLIALTTLALFVIGFAMYYQSRPKTANEQTMQVVVVQPNINPYAKFTADSMATQIKRLVSISKQQVDSNTQLLVWPETALSAGDSQDNTRSNPLYQPVFELLTQFPDKESLLRNYTINELTSQTVFECAMQGDSIANEIFEFTGQILGESLANFVMFSSPEAIVLFGGLTKAGNLLLNPTRQAMEANLLPIFKNKVKLIFSELNESDAAILGASALVW